MKKENYSFPVENELSKIRKKINNPAYLYKNKILPDNASAEEKLKYQICQAILTYQQENNLSAEEIAKITEISLTKTYEILLSKINSFKLGELINYLEKFPTSFEVRIITHSPTTLPNEFINGVR